MNMNPIQIRKSAARLRSAVWNAKVAVAAIAAICASNATAQLVPSYTPGHLLVERIGDGSVALSSAGAGIFLDEYTPGGTLVSTVAIPTTGATALVETGSSTTEGFVSLSPTGTNVVIGGYNVPVGTLALPGTSAANPRMMATVGYNGYTPIPSNTTAFSGGNLRSSATDGNGNFWGSGSITGVIYFGTNAAAGTISTTLANERVIQVFGGNIWFSTGSGATRGVYKITGLPTSGANTAVSTLNSGPGSAPSQYVFSPDGLQAYVADTSNFTNSTTVGGIEKWTNNSGTWSMVYTLFPPASGLTADWTTTPPTIYAESTSGSVLFSLQDTGPGATVTTNATAAANTAFRSLVLVPTNAIAGGIAPTITGISPASQIAPNGGTATITLSGFGGSPAASNNWFEVTGGVTNLLSTHSIGKLTLSNLVTGTYGFFAILTNSSGSVTSSVANLTVTPNPVITAIAPTLVATNPGASVTFTLTANAGTPVASNLWYHVVAGATNLLSDGATGSGSVISGSSTFSLTISNVSLADQTNYFAVLTNSSGNATSAVASLFVSNFPPVITSFTPATLSTSAGQTATYTVNSSGTAPLTYFFYYEIPGTSTNLIDIDTNNTLNLLNVNQANAGSYQVVVSNLTTKTATSSVVTLTVTNDPNIEFEPHNVLGLLGGTVQFSVGAAGTGLTYQWFFADSGSNTIAPISNGIQATGSTVSGAQSGILTIANLHLGDPTNVFAQVTGTVGPTTLTSTIASLVSISLHATNVFWDFNGSEFTNTAINANSLINPVPFLGQGTATAVGTPNFPLGGANSSPFSGAVDANDGLGFTLHLPPFSWGTSHYITNGFNKQNGVEFDASTVGIKNVMVSYEARGTGTASQYTRLQYTTNGTDWTDYPASSTFAGVASTYEPFSYDLTGFPGVANNPAFGFRVVAEFQSTATYGLSLVTNLLSTNYLGVANSFISGATGGFSAGTLTYDRVTIQGDAITNANVPPQIVSTIPDTNCPDFTNVTVSFTVAAGTTPANSLVYNAISLAPNSVQIGSAIFGGSGASRTVKLSPNIIPDQIDAAPILITATDAAGDVAATWFLLTSTSVNVAPTNSLQQLPLTTNILANTSITIPFTVGDDRTPVSGLTYSPATGNSGLVPLTGINYSGVGTANPSVIITPAQNQIGIAKVFPTVNDNDPVEARSTPGNVYLSVLPNTNVIGIDYFSYDASGALDSVASGIWSHLSGNFLQMRVNQIAPGVVTVDTLDFTENLQMGLIGAPYTTNLPPVNPTTLYASFIVNSDPQSTGNRPIKNGTYFAAFNDGSGNTADVEGLVVIATNGAASGFYRLGIANVNGATATNAQMFPVDLAFGSNYAVVESLNLTNGQSTLWVAPQDEDSMAVMDTQSTTLFNIANYELRESGANGGLIGFSHLKIGTTFDSVFPSLTISQSGTNAIVNWNDPSIPIQSTTNLLMPFNDLPGATPPFTNPTPGTNVLFFRFKQ